MSIVDASHQSILKAEEKDNYYIGVLKNHISDIFQRYFGTPLWIKWKKEIEVLAQVLYYSLTTVQGLQTLGEEYVCSIQVDEIKNKKRVPFLPTRLALMMLKCLSTYVINELLSSLQVNLDKIEGITELEVEYWTLMINFLKKFLPVVSMFHTMIFYLDGTYSSISKRLLGIKHVLIRPLAKNEVELPTFRLLALLSTVQISILVYNMFTELQNEFNKLIAESSSEDNEEGACKSLVPRTSKEPSTSKCILCLENVHEMASTVCGHLFCWTCILDWCLVKPACPACREPCPPAKIIRLNHFLC